MAWFFLLFIFPLYSINCDYSVMSKFLEDTDRKYSEKKFLQSVMNRANLIERICGILGLK